MSRRGRTLRSRHLRFFLCIEHGSASVPVLTKGFHSISNNAYVPENGMRRHGGGLGRPPFFCVLKVPTEPARHEIVTLLKPRQVSSQEVLGVPKKCLGGNRSFLSSTWSMVVKVMLCSNPGHLGRREDPVNIFMHNILGIFFIFMLSVVLD